MKLVLAERGVLCASAVYSFFFAVLLYGMLYVFCGDRFHAREISKQFVAACRQKRAHAEYVYVSSSSPSQSLEELLFGQGLFERKCIVFCDELFGDVRAEHLLSNLSLYQDSPHMFVVFEPSLDRSLQKKMERAGASVQRSQERVQREDSRALFSFLDVFLRRDSEKTLSAFYTLVLQGSSASSVLNILLWQLRVLVLVSQSNSAASAGLKPFVFSKAERALRQNPDPLSLFSHAESLVRLGRLQGATDAEIVEHLIVSA